MAIKGRASSERFATRREVCVWGLLFLISAGLGYPTLNRYDPRESVPDAAVYAQMAMNGPSTVSTHLRFRVLVPYLARGVFVVARNHTGSWDPMMFSFLVVNAFLVATTAYLLLRIGRDIVPETSVALLGVSLYLLNFAIANVHLVALVDSAEACLLMAFVASMFYKRWLLLPLWGAIGTLAKESFVPFSIVMAAAWWLTSDEKSNRRPGVWIATAAMVEIAMFVIVHAVMGARAASMWSFVASMNSPTGHLPNLWHSLIDRNSWYILVWLLPLGIMGRREMPHEWKTGAGSGVVVAILLNAYHSTVGGGGGGLGRYVFNIAGPLLSLAAAAFLAEWYCKQFTAEVRQVASGEK